MIWLNYSDKDYMTAYESLKNLHEKTFIVQYGNETYEPVSIMNRKIEETFQIKETMESVGKHKLPDCIVAKSVFTLIVFDKEGKCNKDDLNKAIGFLKLMCDKYEVKNIIIPEASFGKDLNRGKVLNLYRKYFDKSKTRVFLTCSSKKRRK